MKKSISILLIISLFIVLTVGCGGNTSDDSGASSAAVSSELGEPVTMTVICGFPDGDMASDMLIYLCDLIEEKSEGNITFTRHMGGTFCTLAEEYGYVSSGAADLNMQLCGLVVEEMPLWNIAGYDYGYEKSLAQFNYVYFENEETAAACQAEAAAAGVKFLGSLTAGLNVYGARNTEITCLEDLKGLSFGIDRGANVYSSLGLNAMAVAQEDVYESLSRGVIESTNSGIGAYYTNMWYEVAPYLLISQAISSGPYISMNIDRWNSLTEAQQELIQECVDETMAYDLEYYNDFAEQVLTELEAAGCTINYMPEEDDMAYLFAQLEVNEEDNRSYAESLGDGEAFDLVVEATREYLNND
ncbi:MAG: TRAP transporter substrate-binding protein DctP [Oscillospiraceae bacterium]|nr:TRAP transporter substrate-binding protein DctP [Oscillospiraceae bacterium]